MFDMNYTAERLAENAASERVIKKSGFVYVGEHEMEFDTLGNERKHVIPNVLTKTVGEA